MRFGASLVLMATFGCQSGQASSQSRSEPVETQVGLPHGKVAFQSKSGPLAFDVELALDDEAHQRGLMFRKQVPEGTGMLFVFPAEEPRVFWMKNTLVPLDMVFLSASRKVVAIVENAEPLTTTARASGKAAKYVLELAGGTTFGKGIRVGDVATFDGVPGS